MDVTTTRRFVEEAWERSVQPRLEEYIRIPAKSPAFDPDWASRGELRRAVDLVAEWCREQRVPDLLVEVIELEGRTPLLLLEAPGSADDTVLLYGHLDKQPEMVGWSEGLGPWTPVRRANRLYGRGGADDGYAAFSIVTALQALKDQGERHSRCLALIEASEESGSPDLPAHVQALGERIGQPGLVICLDSGCGNYDQLWCTTSLRGMVIGTLTVEVLEEGVHSGDAGGIVPSTFRIARQLLSRLEDEQTGALRPESLHVDIPATRAEQARVAAQVMGDSLWRRFPFVDGAEPQANELAELVLARTWKPSLEVVGAAGLPAPQDAGNVQRPATTLKLSMRLPPTADARAAEEEIAALLTRNPPHGARVSVDLECGASGWSAPDMKSWLRASTSRASRTWFGRDAVLMGEGGSIPFMTMLGESFPDAQFLVTGVLGPESNAHGPNEFLHLPTARKLTCCVAQVLEDHYRSGRG